MRTTLYVLLAIILAGCDFPGKYETDTSGDLTAIYRTNTVTGEVCLLRVNLAGFGKESDDKLEVINCTR
jgi:hypothetical protein